MKDQEQEEVVPPAAGIASAKKVLQKEKLGAALFLEMPWDMGAVVEQLVLEEFSLLEVQGAAVACCHQLEGNVVDQVKYHRKMQAAHYSSSYLVHLFGALVEGRSSVVK